MTYYFITIAKLDSIDRSTIDGIREIVRTAKPPFDNVEVSVPPIVKVGASSETQNPVEALRRLRGHGRSVGRAQVVVKDITGLPFANSIKEAIVGEYPDLDCIIGDTRKNDCPI